ncbi:putative eukaryotic translation initiation factor 4 gamma [Erysiphe necator]|uniref:Putative eukaryotic translation initiation factor 4 gamma n=1 Tax=Uncinula necator TaxID=52586 RepID=A0A0B1P4U4_UNCNE|nr:putative eukaryotic translation initiation factor 4 gamma [Erysiphe necator]
MTPTPQPSQIPSQATSASISTPSYSSAAKKAVSSPTVAAGSSSQSSIVAVGSSGSVQPSHGKSSPVLPINGKHSISPAVPAVSAPVIAYSSSVINGASNHNRKSSVTIVANGRHSMNGGPVGGSSGKIQFGSITDSPASSHITPQIYQHSGTPPGSILNPRVSDPSHSPTPIPQPSASGGRPQVVGPGNGVNFGSFGGDSDRHIRQVSGPQHPQVPGVQHVRHDSTQPGQSDLSNQQGRGAYPHQGGRGRGGFQNQFQQHQMNNFPQMNNSFRNTQNQGRGGIPPFQSQGRPPYSSSPHQPSRSPALPTSLPGTPSMNPSMPIPNQQQYANHFFSPHMAGPQYGYPPQFDARALPLQATGYLYPQITCLSNMAFVSAPPQSPQTAFQQTHYTPGQYAPQAQQMSRNSSQISDHQQTSNLGQPRTPSITSIVLPLTPKPSVSNTVSFTRPTRKNAAIVIKRPDGEAVDVGSFKAPSSPAPNARPRTPPIISSNPTIPPKPSTPIQATHTSGSPGIKTSDQIKQEMKEKVMKAAAEDHLTSAKPINPIKDSEAKIDEEKSNNKINNNETEQSEEVKITTNTAKDLEEEKNDEIERQIAEIEAAELERAKKEAEILKKRDAQRLLEKARQEKLSETTRKEQDRILREKELEMERLEDEKEKIRAQAERKNGRGEQAKSVKDLLNETSKKEEMPSHTAENNQIPKLMTPSVGVETGASSTLDEVMGPPQKINSADKRMNKPVALDLKQSNGKPIEPPQPSAALRSLKSARFLTVLDPMIYPPSISSPNPALNQAVKDKGRSFKYDKEFLLQFQKVFIEKPSMEFESQIKALIGEPETGSTRSGSTRTSENTTSRSNSSRNSTQAGFTTGAFASFGSGKSLTSGSSANQRYSLPALSMARTPINPMVNFIHPRNNGPPAGNPMSRNPSNSGMPHSPRQQSRRGNASNKGFNPSNAKQEAQAAKTMPLTAGLDVRPIQVSATGWKPRSIGNSQSGPVPGASNHMDPDMVQRKVKAALNKMTPEKFDKISDQIFAIAAQSKFEADGRTLRQVIQLTFEKATDEAHWASMYAKFCKRMLETMSSDIKDETILDKNGEVVSGGNLFRKYLLNRCQEEFERGWKIDLPEKPEDERAEEKTEEAALLSDEYYIAAAAKRRGLGLVQFIGELYKLGMLTERIMHQCVMKLVDYKGVPDEAEVESLIKLLKTIGANLEASERGRQVMDAYFDRIKSMIKSESLPSRLRFMLMDIVDLRLAHWASKELNKGPKTLDEVRIEAEAAAAQKAAESARNSQRGGGGGGNRMSMGRGDSRNFSNQYGNQQMSDSQRNIVPIDEIRKLSTKTNNPRSSNQTFAPSTLFSRTNSGRKMGASGAINRLGEDSGISSRSGTPPQMKERESTTSVNAFSLLAVLGSSETENPTSPPSISASPALSKSTPVSTEKSDK